MDWYDLKFLESPANLKGFIKESIGRSPSTSVSTEISTCLQQGRLFFEAAENSPLEIRPLQVFYGVVGFSKALISARNAASTGTLAQAHGLKDKSERNARLENSIVSIASNGTFQQFNDTICNLECINYFGIEHESLRLYKSTDKSCMLAGKSFTLKTILSRNPNLCELYKKTFKAESECLLISLNHFHSEFVELRLDVPAYFIDRDSLKVMIEGLRAKFPFLNYWALASAQRAWNNSILIFRNHKFQPDEEFSDYRLVETDGRFKMNLATIEQLNFATLLPSLSGGITNGTPFYISPVDGLNISEHSIMYLGLFLLSSLVRYRPDVWVHSIRGRNTPQRSSDDHCMAIIEAFLNGALSSFPRFVFDAMRVKV